MQGGLGSGVYIDLSGYRIALDEARREYIVFIIKIKKLLIDILGM